MVEKDTSPCPMAGTNSLFFMLGVGGHAGTRMGADGWRWAWLGVVGSSGIEEQTNEKKKTTTNANEPNTRADQKRAQIKNRARANTREHNARTNQNIARVTGTARTNQMRRNQKCVQTKNTHAQEQKKHQQLVCK